MTSYRQGKFSFWNWVADGPAVVSFAWSEEPSKSLSIAHRKVGRCILSLGRLERLSVLHGLLVSCSSSHL